MGGNTFAPEMQVKQYVAVIRSSTGRRWRVFETGDPKFWLFEALAGETSASHGLQIPVLKTRVRRDLNHALRHGFGNSL